MNTVLGTGAGLAVPALIGAAWTRGRLPRGLGPLEQALAWLLVGVALVAMSSLALADVGLFTPVALVGACVLLVVGGVLATRGVRRRGGLPPRPLRRDLALAGLVALLLAVALPPFEWVLGGRDPGTYVNAAEQMRDSHATVAGRPELREVPREVLPHLSLWEPDQIGDRAPPPPPADPYRRDLWPGMYLRKPDGVLPQGFHLFPALLAAAGVASGDEGLWSIALLAVLVLLACALLAGRLAEGLRPGAAELATGAVLVSGLGFVWYARYPTAELLDAAMLVGGAWLWTLASRAGSGWTAGLAGAVTGASLLTRADAVLLLPAVLGLATALVVLGRFGVTARRFCALFGGVTALAGLHAAVFTRPYLDDVSAHSPAGWTAVSVALAAGFALAAAAVHWRAPVAARLRALGRPAPGAALLALVALAAVAQARGWVPFFWLRWHLGEVGLLVAGAGVAVLLSRLRSERAPEGAWLLLILAAATLALYLPDARISPDLPWGFRRFLPVVLPVWALLCGMAAAAALAYQGPRRRVVRVAATGVAGVALVQLGLGLAPTLGHREYSGADRVVERLDERLGRGRPLVLFGAHDVVLHRFGPAIGIARERFAFPVTAISARPLVSWLSARSRREKVLLVTYGRELPRLSPRLQARPVSAVGFSLPEMERPLDRLPRHAHRLSGELVIWRLTPAR